MTRGDSLSLLRQDVLSHAKSISELVSRLAELDDFREETLRDIVRRDERAVRTAEHIENLRKDIRKLEERLNARLDNISKLGWLVATAFTTAAVGLIVNFIFRGGFFNGP